VRESRQLSTSDEDFSLSTHIDPGDLALFLRGALDAAKTRRVLAHLARCQSCRRLLEPRLPPPAAPDPAEAPARPGASQPGSAAIRQALRICDERVQTRKALAGGRQFEDLRPAALARLGGFARVELLLEASRAQRYTSPAKMVHLAELAVCELRRLSGRRYGSAPLADLRAIAWAELGNAHRVADNLPASSSCLARAARSARRGTGSDSVTARLVDLSASLWADQGRFADAIEALERLAILYRELGDDHLAGRALIKRGIFLGHDNQHRRAIVSLTTGLSLVDVEREPGLQLSAMHDLVSMLVFIGQYSEARLLLWQVQHLHNRDGSPLNLVRLRWLWGRIYSGLGDLGKAEKELHAARDGFSQAGKPYHQALVSLDLAEIYVRQDRRSEARALASEMLVTFRRLGIAREIIAVLLLTRERCMDPHVGAEALCLCFREVAVLVAELDRVPTRRRRGAKSGSYPPSLFV